jgi:hypothetical protein
LTSPLFSDKKKIRERGTVLSMHFLQRATVCFLSAFLLISCARQNVRIVDEGIQRSWLPFIENGKTTKDEVLTKLGMPSRQFEGGRIITYHMTFSEEKGFRVDVKRQFIYNLVLVFDKRNILEKHRFLKLKSSMP